MTSAPAGRPAPWHLAVALDGAGWHPGAWREEDAQPQRLFTAGYWTELAQRAERGLLDFLTIEDGLNLQSDDHFRADSRTDRGRGRLDAVLIAARAAPATRHIGFVPTAITTHTEPFREPGMRAVQRRTHRVVQRVDHCHRARLLSARCPTGTGRG